MGPARRGAVGSVGNGDPARHGRLDLPHAGGQRTRCRSRSLDATGVSWSGIRRGGHGGLGDTRTTEWQTLVLQHGRRQCLFAACRGSSRTPASRLAVAVDESSHPRFASAHLTDRRVSPIASNGAPAGTPSAKRQAPSAKRAGAYARGYTRMSASGWQAAQLRREVRVERQAIW